ncbi:Npun_F0494 family protein [Prochlorococcus sp. MIT 1223]|uniref:Npun_F0494 family protein n=1 Tax=Prochlorococcus sp. MIT 1223 TaxID=3096217 RepID=UPI002A74A8E8|nr:Npun_F0494 family protein [Prochlorococcus sp. MIT 1223]
MQQSIKNQIKRSERAIKCLNFKSKFYKDAQLSGISAEEVFEMKSDYLSTSLSSLSFKRPEKIESDFIWLITIGILRREVDGQGLTSKVRLTPLGREIIENFPHLADQKALLIERITECIFRKIRLK